MKIPVAVRVAVVMLASLFAVIAYADGAQQPNPLFVEASGLSQQLAASSLNDNARTAWARRFQGLEEVQQQLWSLAGQVDAGQCTDSCIDLYNSRVVAWQSSLQTFITDAKATLHAQQNTPESMYKCWGVCDRKHTACWKRCLDRPIDENAACHATCNDEKNQCAAACQ